MANVRKFNEPIRVGSVASAPAADNGMIYFDSALGKLRTAAGGEWRDVHGVTTFATLAAVKAASGADDEICYVVETATFYKYEVTGAAYAADDKGVLITGDAGDTRWLGVAGQYFADYPTLGAWTSGSGVVATADTVLEALQKVDGNVGAVAGDLSTHEGLTDNPHTVTKAQVLTGDLIVDTDINAAAAIAQSKLSLSITNNEVAAAAAIAESKLALDFSTAALQSQISQGKVWKEALLCKCQLKDGASGGIYGANVIVLTANLETGDTITLHDGVAPESYVAGTHFAVGLDIDATLANLAAATNGGAIAVSAVTDKLSSLDSNNVLVIYQDTIGEPTRVYGNAGAVARVEILPVAKCYDGLASDLMALPASDPEATNFGFSRAKASLAVGETHFVRVDDIIYTWDVDGETWQNSGSSSVPLATKDLPGKVQVGEGVAVSSGVISVDVDGTTLGLTGDVGSKKVGVMDGVFEPADADIQTHITAVTGNPHQVTLQEAWEVDDTGIVDTDKSFSIAMQYVGVSSKLEVTSTELGSKAELSCGDSSVSLDNTAGASLSSDLAVGISSGAETKFTATEGVLIGEFDTEAAWWLTNPGVGDLGVAGRVEVQGGFYAVNLNDVDSQNGIYASNLAETHYADFQVAFTGAEGYLGFDVINTPEGRSSTLSVLPGKIELRTLGDESYYAIGSQNGVRRGLHTDLETQYVSEHYLHATTLTKAQTNATALTFDKTKFEGAIIDYKIKQATTNRVRIGQIMVVAQGANVSLVDTSTETADVEIAWSAAISVDDVQVRYTSGVDNDCVMRADVKYIQA